MMIVSGIYIPTTDAEDVSNDIVINASSESKIHPLLQRVINSQAEINYSHVIGFTNSAPEIIVFYNSSTPENTLLATLSQVEELYLNSIIPRFSLFTASASPNAILALSQLPEIIRINPSFIMKPTLNIAREDTKTTIMHRALAQSGGTTITGKNTIIAIIDSGIDWTHEDFNEISVCPYRRIYRPIISRIVYIYDYITQEELYNSDINQELEYIYCERIETGIRSTDSYGHGTHVAGIAAGNGKKSGGLYKGIAPSAYLMIVNIDMPERVAFENRFIEAINKILTARELDRDNLGLASMPIVFSISWAYLWGFRDGTSSLEQVIDQLSGSGISFVIGAGNEGETSLHVSGTISNTQTPIFLHTVPDSETICLPSEPRCYSAIDAEDFIRFSNEPTNVTIKIGRVINQTLQSPLLNKTYPDDGMYFGSEGTIRVDWENGTSHLWVEIEIPSPRPSEPPEKDFYIQLSTTTGDVYTFNSWVIGPYALSYHTIPIIPNQLLGDTVSSITSPATAHRGIAVGAYVTKDSRSRSLAGVGSIALYSGNGPAGDGTLKPEISAPGEIIKSVRSKDGLTTLCYTYDTYYCEMGGTSMAAPMVAGAVALLYQLNPLLTPEEIKSILIKNRREDAFTETNADPLTSWHPAYGYGKLNLDGATLKPFFSNSYNPVIQTDSANNIHILFFDDRTGTSQLYYKKLNSDGNLLIFDTQITTDNYDKAQLAQTIDSYGNIHAVWVEWGVLGNQHGQIFYTKLDNNGNVLISPTQITSFKYYGQYQPSIIADSSNGIHVVWQDWRDSREQLYYIKIDGSKNKLKIDVFEKRLTDTPKRFDNIKASAVDADGNVYIVWQDYRDAPGWVGGNAEIYMMRTDNMGNPQPGFSNGMRITIDPANSYLPDLRLDSSGNINIVWVDERDGNGELFYKKLAPDGGVLISDKQITFTTSAKSHHTMLDGPKIDIDSSNRIHIVWEDNRDGNWEIYYKVIDTSGNTIVSDKRLTSEIHDSLYPDITVGTDNYIRIVWQDNRYGQWDYFYTDNRIVTTLDISTPKYITPAQTYVTSNTVFRLSSTRHDIYYSVSGAPYTRYYFSPFSLTGSDGPRTISYYSSDYYPEMLWGDEPTRTMNVFLDNTPPVTSIKVVGDTVYLMPSDTGSGTYVTYYKYCDYTSYPPCTQWIVYTGPVTLPPGDWLFLYYSKDNLGNTERVKSRWVSITGVSPGLSPTIGSVEFPSDPISVSTPTPNINEKVTFTISIKSNVNYTLSNVYVNIYSLSQPQLIANAWIPLLDANATLTFEVTWMPTIGGNHTIEAYLDNNTNLNDGYITSATVNITVLEIPFAKIEAYQLINATLRVTGEKWNKVTMYIYENGEIVNTTYVERTPGSPEEQKKTISFRKHENSTYDLILIYTARKNGANPVKVILESGDEDETLHYTFNAQQGKRQVKVENIDKPLAELVKENFEWYFDASQSYVPDAVSYEWDFGDGNISSGVSVNHIYELPGTYEVTLKITNLSGLSYFSRKIINIILEED